MLRATPYDNFHFVLKEREKILFPGRKVLNLSCVFLTAEHMMRKVITCELDLFLTQSYFTAWDTDLAAQQATQSEKM